MPLRHPPPPLPALPPAHPPIHYGDRKLNVEIGNITQTNKLQQSRTGAGSMQFLLLSRFSFLFLIVGAVLARAANRSVMENICIFMCLDISIYIFIYLCINNFLNCNVHGVIRSRCSVKFGSRICQPTCKLRLKSHGQNICPKLSTNSCRFNGTSS